MGSPSIERHSLCRRICRFAKFSCGKHRSASWRRRLVQEHKLRYKLERKQRRAIEPKRFSIVVDPVSPSTIYLSTRATSGGGFYKSTDSGATWTTLNNGLSSYTIFGMAQSQTTPATFYLATELGVFKTTNGGNNWTISSTGLPGSVFYPSLPGATSIRSSLTRPTRQRSTPDRQQAAFIKSTDSGSTWTAINTGLTNKNINVLAVNPTATGTVYAGLGGFSATGVYKNNDATAAKSWTTASSGLPTSNAVNTLVFDPTNSNTIFAAAE